MEQTYLPAEIVLQFVNQTQQSIFLTGKAGTGKTTLLKKIIETTHKNTVVVAPTGIAALNAGGVTIHSMFQLPFGGFIPVNSAVPHITSQVKFETPATLRRHFRMSAVKKNVIQNMELLIIDEVSMLRADLLDAMDYMLRKTRKNERAFGGVQVIFIGDLLQLPPVIKPEEWQILQQYYKGIFFFNAHVLTTAPPLYIELEKIYRQSDADFIQILNNLRNNTISANDLQVLQSYVQPNFDVKNHKGYITLTTHNYKADSINAKALQELEGDTTTFLPKISGDFPEKMYPVEETLHLKVGAQVMFIKNDLSPEKRYYNGKMGVVKSLAEEEIFVHFPEEDFTIEVERYEWENIRYNVNEQTKEIEEEVLGSFVHYPIKLAWAITVHKSQGLTFEKAVLDVSQVFLPGQAYVALSRLTSLKGLVLLSPMRLNGLSNDLDVMQYANTKADETSIKSTLEIQTTRYIEGFIKSSFNFMALANAWKTHQMSYNTDSERSAKTKYTHWAKEQSDKMMQLLEPSRKFVHQLDGLLARQKPDIDFLDQRIRAAFDYFFPLLENIHLETLSVLEHVKRTKKAKEFYHELTALEDQLTLTVIQLFKVKVFIALLKNNIPINKQSLQATEIKNYRRDLIAEAARRFKATKLQISEDDEDKALYAKKEKKQKTDKVPTTTVTYELWKSGKTIEEIAEIRNYVPSTIQGHLAKLVGEGFIEVSAILDPDEIQKLQMLFDKHPEATNGEIKEIVGDEFSWGALKLFRAHLDYQNAHINP